MYIWPTLTFFSLIPCVLSSHFRGGLLTWKAINETQVIINHRTFYVSSHCPGPQSDTLSCVGGCTGSVTMIGYCKDNSTSENWADLEGVTRFDIDSTSTSVILQFSGGAWISLVHFSGSWSLRMTVDLSVRSDTGKINQSPVSSAASTIILSQTCSSSDSTFYIPVADFDGDIVGCRFASGSNECANVCGNHVSFLTFDEASCSFTINSNISIVTAGNYAVALQIEDFTDSSSSVPLSSVPLQFIINVDNGTICPDSVYFVDPTPTAGKKLQTQNGFLQLYARARVNNTSVTKFHIMSPLNFTMSAIVQHGTHEFEVTITLESNSEDLNATHVMCFSAETKES